MRIFYISMAVVVPVFNRAHTVLKTLTSIANQTRQPDTVIIIDDGSVDGTHETVRDWDKTTNLKSRMIRTENRGAGAARNLGLLHAGENTLIAFVDSDDIWPADFLERGIAALEHAPNAIAATADRLLEFADGHKRLDLMNAIADNSTRWLCFHGGGIASATVFRTNAVQRLGGFPEKWKTGQDSALFLPLSLEGDWLHLPGAPVRQLIGYSAAVGEQGNLSAQFADRERIWAEIHEDFVLNGRGRTALRKNEYELMLSMRWYRAGRDLMRQKRRDEAKSCFKRAIRWRFHRKAWLKLILSYIYWPKKISHAGVSL
jgi:glycosyltransferase involved in cell wall biosynthesis